MRLLFCAILALCFASCVNDKERKKELPPKDNVFVEAVQNPSTENSQLPRLFSNGKELYFSWVTRKDSADVLNYAVLRDTTWTPSTEIIEGNDWFTNWADFPNIAENNGRILTSFLQKSDSGTYTYDVKLNLYNPETKEWKKNFILHNDGTKSEHGFVSVKPYAHNSFAVTWLDGRETVGKGHGGGQMTLRAALVFEDGTIDYDTLLDEKVCDCCNTALAIGPKDQIIVAYRDRSDEEIRDISVTDWTMEANWSAPRTIGNDNWKIAGCPVNGPALDTYEEATVAAWFTAANEEGEVKVAFSSDGVKTFSEPIRIDAGNATGRVDVVMLSASEAAVLWMEPSGEDEVIQLARVKTDGTISEPINIAKTSAERASGFPQVEKVGNTLYMAWTVVEGEDSRIEMASVDVGL
ncbi:hypothetical protein POV27_15495 [Aureisphaera galaxeae]|uniref:hypothetical protein n=1 Tax=Aureisphaera galaxeae TaxID=1538023 RepID=UPI00235072DF|nr:hypothetical protein [Aureisphaera galaxeae]MDC8005462.1 hypothetical protein [Aureisphaera galaxeae]